MLENASMLFVADDNVEDAIMLFVAEDNAGRCYSDLCCRR
jgi:hypothetical protein